MVLNIYDEIYVIVSITITEAYNVPYLANGGLFKGCLGP